MFLRARRQALASHPSTRTLHSVYLRLLLNRPLVNCAQPCSKRSIAGLIGLFAFAFGAILVTLTFTSIGD